jgi:uncharacterized damage-inducible protein DinB
MSISALLLPEFDQEVKVTRTTLQRVPMKPDFAPHEKSMKLKNLAPHIAQLGAFGLTILTTPELDFGKSNYAPLAFESAEQLVKVFEEGAAKVRSAIESTQDASWNDKWRLAWNDKTIFEGPRFLAYREMFLNHLVHHRAQLGVYLRINNVPVPATYGPSADDTLGF